MAWPDTSLDVEVSLALGANINADPTTWTWTDITAYVFDRDEIRITRGRGDEQSQSEPSTCTLTLNNLDGRFSPRNSTGAYYGTIGRNTPLRVRVDPGTGNVTRFVGYVSEWPPRWDPGERHQWASIQVDGVLRRLGQGQSPLRSALFTALSRSTPLAAYWPCEDGVRSTGAASGLASGSPMVTAQGAVAFATNTAVPGSGPLPVFSSGDILTGPASALPPSAASVVAEWSVEFSALLVAGFYVPVTWYVGGTLQVWQFTVLSGTDIRILAYQADGTQQSAVIFAPSVSIANAPHNWCVTAIQVGADINVQLFQDGVSAGTGTLTTQTLGAISKIDVGGFPPVDIAIGHVAIYRNANQTGHEDAFNGHAGEISGTRVSRLCSEAGVIVDVTAGSTEAMGVQGLKTLLDLLRECEAAEEGLLVERLTGKLGFDPHSVRENKSINLTLDYALKHLTPSLEPTDDDQRTRNDVTVTREGGSFARAERTSGPLSTDPTTGVGRYEEAVTLSLNRDSQPVQHANWRLNLGTADGLRFPRVSLNLRRNSSLIAAWLAADIGSRVLLTNLPNNISYDDVDLIVEGYTETMTMKSWDVTLNCAPYRPYGVFQIASASGDTAEFLGRLMPDNMELIVAATSGATTFTVETIPKFTVDSDDYPMKLIIEGETVTATAASVVAPSFIAAGTAAHADNASVQPGLPAGAQAGDLLPLLAAIRSSGTGTVNVPAGYTPIALNGNMRLMAKIHDGNEVAPTVSFAGGVPGDTCSAQMAAFRGVGLDFLFDRDVLNGSAQDIITPRFELWEIVDDEGNLVDNALILLIAWKQDDWTSSAQPAGFTEIGEPSSILGNDQGITWAFQIQTTATAVAGSSFVITGGAAAISRATIVALRSDVINLTITRSANGVVKAHPKGAKLEINEPGLVLAL